MKIMKIGKAWKVTISYLIEKGYKQTFAEFFKFVLHFVGVMVFMICGAIVFTSLEEKDFSMVKPRNRSADLSLLTKNVTHHKNFTGK